MCGIAGIWERSGRPVDRAALERMAASPRTTAGPTAPASTSTARSASPTGASRSSTRRPRATSRWASQERGLWLTYNGEIHNYVELRRELESLGARFRTHTDTEVVLARVRGLGDWTASSASTGCGRSRSGTRASGGSCSRRDRFGIKPLCYSQRGGRIAFASEPKAILAAVPGGAAAPIARRDRPLPRAATSPTRATRRSSPGIRNAAAPARCLVVTPRRGARDRLLGLRARARRRRVADAEERFRALLHDSIRLRMRSDVPVGACLSGGLDSSAIAALVERSEPGGADAVLLAALPDGSRASTRAATPPRPRRRAATGSSCTGCGPTGDDLLGHDAAASSGTTTRRCRCAGVSRSGAVMEEAAAT